MVGVVALLHSQTFSLDTTEPFDPGFSDNEFYLSFSGQGRELGAEYVVGVGVTDKLSTVFSFVTTMNHYFDHAGTELGAGLFLNTVDSDMFKLDFSLGMSSEGGVGVGMELNFDFERAGIQLGVEEGIAVNADVATETDFTTTVGPLVYFSINDQMQLLSAFDIAFPDHADVEIGGVGLGFNAVVNDAIELISEVGFDIPQGDESFTVGVSLGFVATVP
jgi:hypothetical protein